MLNVITKIIAIKINLFNKKTPFSKKRNIKEL